MPTDSRNQIVKNVKTRKYLNKDFDSLKADLLEYARMHFPDKIKDFSEPSFGGLMLELAAYVGDEQSFYLDHQFHELNPELAVESRNIQAHIRNAGVQIVGAAPAVVDLTFEVTVLADTTVSPPIPSTIALPIIYAGTVASSQNNIQFETLEDIDFSDRDQAGNLKATVAIAERDSNNQPTFFTLSATVSALSGFRTSESFTVSSFEPFKKYTLGQANVTDIISVRDTLGNTYYEVEFLTQDIVFQSVTNLASDNEEVSSNLQLLPCPYRFVKQMSLDTRLTTLTFGGGTAETLDNDIIPDPSEFALPLYGKTTIPRFTLNPTQLLSNSTLGVIGSNTTITVEYRYGGGLSHNVEPNAIRSLTNLIIAFPQTPSVDIANRVRQSISVRNQAVASGGDDAPNLDDLKLQVPASAAAQSRIVSREDLLARVYTMPANFGRVFRAAIRQNPNNPLSSLLYVISRNSSGRLIVSPDSLKKNLVKYLNSYRMISDAIDILDAQVINLQIEFTIVANPAFNRALVLGQVLNKLRQYFNTKFYEIDQPIILEDIRNLIYNNQGVMTIQSLALKNITGMQGTREYSDVQFDPVANTTRGILIGTPGSIFEIRYKDNDIIGNCY